MTDIDASKPAPPNFIPLGHPGITVDQPLYHWSPSGNRDAIKAEGLRIRSRSTEGTWRPPFVTFASTPNLAWSLSALRTDYDNKHASWDLWMLWTGSLRGLETIPFDDGEPREYRVYHSIKPDKVWFVGARLIAD